MRAFGSDGLLARGRVIDRKTYDFAGSVSPVPAGEPIHDMGVRLVYDAHCGCTM
jgi:hypothetical protein